MSKSASQYPITQLLTSFLQTTGHTRDGIIFALGYRNLRRGRRRLDDWIDRGAGEDRIIKQISLAFPAVAEALDQAVTATRAMKTAETEAAFLVRCKAEAATFEPFVHAEGEVTVPNGICIFGMTGGFRRWTRIPVPAEIAALPVEEQLTQLPPLMLAYKEEYKGFVPFFGKLRGFKLVRLLDYFQFDPDGQLVGHVNKPFRHGTVGVSVG